MSSLFQKKKLKIIQLNVTNLKMICNLLESCGPNWRWFTFTWPLCKYKVDLLEWYNLLSTFGAWKATQTIGLKHYPWTQWATVKMCRSLTRTPPQNWSVPSRRRAAIHGHSPSSAGAPPWIRYSSFSWTPHSATKSIAHPPVRYRKF